MVSILSRSRSAHLSRSRRSQFYQISESIVTTKVSLEISSWFRKAPFSGWSLRTFNQFLGILFHHSFGEHINMIMESIFTKMVSEVPFSTIVSEVPSNHGLEAIFIVTLEALFSPRSGRSHLHHVLRGHFTIVSLTIRRHKCMNLCQCQRPIRRHIIMSSRHSH